MLLLVINGALNHCRCAVTPVGDLGDVLMIGMSMAVFIYLAMQMYRLYYYVYLQLGVMDMMG